MKQFISDVQGPVSIRAVHPSETGAGKDLVLARVIPDRSRCSAEPCRMRQSERGQPTGQAAVRLRKNDPGAGSLSGKR